MKKSWQFARSPVLLLLFATGVIAAVLGCPLTQPPIQKAPDRVPAMDSGPCPHYFSLFFANRYREGTIWSLAGHQLDVPEYNDCQRLLVRKGHVPPKYTELHFGNVGVIFARANLNDVYRQELPIGSAIGPFTAVLKNPNPATTRVTTIAFVWTTGGYAPLGLNDDYEFACVVLQWEPAVASNEKRQYHAWMVSVSPETSCAKPLELSPSHAYYLGALEFPAQSNADGPDEIPAVARWDWDPQNGEQYIGIACPSGWCELYGEGPHKLYEHSTSPKYMDASGLKISGKAGRVVRQKGWYDEEYLASTIKTPGGFPVLDPAGAFGTVFPVPDLKDRNIESYHLGAFVPVAWISITAASSGYLGKYGIRFNTAPPQRPDVNVLSLCLDDGTNNFCKVKMNHLCHSTRDQSSGYFFYARIVTGPDDPEGKDFCVDYIGTDPTVSTPGTVRWRWLDNDQTIWVSCPAGCCQIKPPQ